MTAPQDLDLALEQCHLALGEFVKGDPEPLKDLYSHRDDATLANPFYPAPRGWAGVAKAMEGAASRYRDGAVTGFERVVAHETPELACIVEVERYEVKLGGSDDLTPVALRVTTVLRPEDGAWKIVHRHADPITSERPTESVIRAE
jgi:ketosteroid isomerase-like protein